jgi:hypothetical protein
MDKKDNGTAMLGIMAVIIVIEMIVCVVFPLAVPGFSKQGWSLPAMVIALLLPYIYFFIFAGAQVARNRKNKK